MIYSNVFDDLPDASVTLGHTPTGRACGYMREPFRTPWRNEGVQDWNPVCRPALRRNGVEPFDLLVRPWCVVVRFGGEAAPFVTAAADHDGMSLCGCGPTRPAVSIAPVSWFRVSGHRGLNASHRLR